MAEAAIEVETAYFTWPAQIISLWIALQTIFSIIVLGIYAQFIAVQHDLGRPVPWYFSMSLAVAVLTLFFLGLMLILYNVRLLTPFYMLAFATIGFILWLVSLIGTSLGLFANQNNAANDYCHASGINWTPLTTETVVYGTGVAGSGYTTVVPTTTVTAPVLVLIGQQKLALFFWNQLCGAWKAAFVFQLFACLAFLYMIYLAFDVLQSNRKDVVIVEEEEV